MIRHCQRCGDKISSEALSKSVYARRMYCSLACRDFEPSDVEVVELLRSIPDFAPMEYKEIAELTGVTKQRIEQIERQALAKLRGAFQRRPELICAYGYDPNGETTKCDVTFW